MKSAEHARAKSLARLPLLIMAGVLGLVSHSAMAGGTEEAEPTPPPVTILVAYQGTPDAAANPAHRLAGRLKRGIAERLGTRVSVELYPEGRLGPVTDRLGAEVERNLIEIVSATELADAFSPVKAAELPFLFSDFETARSFYVSSDFIGRAETELSEGFDAELLAATVSGGPRMFNSTGPVLRSPADFEGLRLLVGSAPEAAVVSAFGAKAEVAARHAVAQRISGGDADGWIATAEEIASLGLSEELAGRTDLAVSYPALYVLAYNSGLSALEPAQREAVREAAASAAGAVGSAAAEDAQEAAEQLRSGGVAFYRPSAAEAELFSRLGQAAYLDSIEGDVSLEWIMLAREE
jgi:TRAP-type C4-dicarboxylate transport system substrate-binding protein